MRVSESGAIDRDASAIHYVYAFCPSMFCNYFLLRMAWLEDCPGWWRHFGTRLEVPGICRSWQHCLGLPELHTEMTPELAVPCCVALAC